MYDYTIITEEDGTILLTILGTDSIKRIGWSVHTKSMSRCIQFLAMFEGINIGTQRAVFNKIINEEDDLTRVIELKDIA